MDWVLTQHDRACWKDTHSGVWSSVQSEAWSWSRRGK